MSGGFPDWLLRLLAIDPERVRGGTEHFRLARFPEGGTGLLVLLLLCLGFVVILAMYRREGRLPRWRKIAFAALRCILLSGIVLSLQERHGHEQCKGTGQG